MTDITRFTAPEGESREEIETHGPFRVDSEGAANWVLGKLAQARAAAAAIESQYQDALAILEARRTKLLAAANRDVPWWESLLLDYATTHRADLIPGRSKTRSYINGAISFRRSAPKVVVEDRDELGKWLAQHPDLARVKVEPDLTAIKEFVAQTGEIPPGCDLTPETESITFKTDLNQLED